MCRTHPETFIRDVALFLLLALVIVLYFVGHFGVTGYKMYSPFQYLQLFLYAPLGLYRIWIYAAKISRNLVKLKVNWLLLLFRFSQVIVNTVDLCHQKVGAWAEASLAQCFKTLPRGDDSRFPNTADDVINMMANHVMCAMLYGDAIARRKFVVASTLVLGHRLHWHTGNSTWELV